MGAESCVFSIFLPKMNNIPKRLFVAGFPGLYGGAGMELLHQIYLWRHMGLEVHLIPTNDTTYGDTNMICEMQRQQVYLHEANQWDVLAPGDPVFGFCNPEFLEKLPDIRRYTKRTVFINCMTWLFDKEKEAMEQGLISLFLYQNEDVRRKVMPELKALNADPAIRFLTFTPYFHSEDFPFIEERPADYFGCGRISRQDEDKFAADTLMIYEYFAAPVPKRGVFLGFDYRSEKKVGKPMSWIRTAYDQNEISQQEFYKHCRIILQPMDTEENWPRIGFEAMSSGSVLIVDNRGGWKRLIEHGKTGWLCDHERDFIYYASKMAYEPHLRDDMACAARERGLQLGGLEAAAASWEEVLSVVASLPE